jgi:hypothetical protein
MRVTARIVFLLAAIFLAGLTGRGGEVIPVLKAGSETFTNVVVTRVTATHVFFRHAGGFGSVKRSDLYPGLQKELANNPSNTFQRAVPKAAREDVVNPYSWWAKSTANTNTNAVARRPPGWVARDFAIGNKGTLTLLLPDLWTNTILPAPNVAAPYVTIRFKRPYEDDFLLQIDTIPPGERILAPGAQAVVSSIGNRSLAGAVETELHLQELKGAEASGYYFALSDKKLANVLQPRPGTYKYQMQGLVIIDGMGLSFTIFYNYFGSPDPDSALEVIRNASFSNQLPKSPPDTKSPFADKYFSR